MMSSKKTFVGMFLVGLYLIGNSNQVFGHHFEVCTEFNKIDTLQPGAKVRVSGMDAGSVSDIEVPKTPSSRFRLKVEVEQKFHPIVRDDSLATIETAGMFGNK